MKRQFSQISTSSSDITKKKPSDPGSSRTAVLISFVNEIVIVLDVDATVAGEYIGLSGSSRPIAIMLFVSEY
jgi:hypothetical protein